MIRLQIQKKNRHCTWLIYFFNLLNLYRYRSWKMIYIPDFAVSLWCHLTVSHLRYLCWLIEYNAEEYCDSSHPCPASDFSGNASSASLLRSY